MNAEPSPVPATAELRKPSIFLVFLATVIAAATGTAFWYLRNNPTPEPLKEWETFLGMSHPLAIHFPVATILLVALLGILGGRRRPHDGAICWLLWINLLACSAGILLGHFAGADFGEGKLRNHLLSGLAVGGCSYLALVFFLVRSGSVTTGLYRLCIIAAVAAVTVAGHFGATLSHGEILDELPWKKNDKAEAKTPATPGSDAAAPPVAATNPPAIPPAPAVPAPAPPPPPAAENQAANPAIPATAAVAHDEKSIFDAVIAPILNARCASCHGEEKQKGEIRLDIYPEIFNVGDSGKPSVVAKNSAESESVLRMELPVDDEDHMPPSKKPQHTADELDIFKWWIDEGADREMKIKSAPADLIEKLRSAAQNPPQPAST